MAVQTLNFERCWGVLQGGGCRAVALAGAYEAAFNAGVRFTRVAGTSAGSIVATLIGAGATAEFVSGKIKELDFNAFLQPATGQRPRAGLKAWVAKSMMGIVLPKDKAAYLSTVEELLNLSGLYSSARIESWMDDMLAELLPEAKRPIRFGDLLYPTYVVATNLLSAAPTVWSKENSPDARVGFAVRASCSIPGFFQPVAEGDNRYVDGGVVSNLPGFVFLGGDKEASETNELILAIGLKGNYKAPGEWSAEELLQRVINASIDGAIDIQKRLLSKQLYVVEVPTGDVLATDFRRMAQNREKLVPELLRNGIAAMEEFVRDEPNRVSVRQPLARVCTDEDQAFCAVIERSRLPVEQVIVAHKNTAWAWKIVPTLLRWSHSGAAIRVYVEAQNGGTPQETARRLLLRGLGAEVIVKDCPLPFTGFLLDVEDPRRASAVVQLEPSAASAGFATVYAGGASHFSAIHALVRILEGPAMFQGSMQQCTLTNLPNTQVLKARLQTGVHQYSDPDVTFHVEDISVESLMLLYYRVREFKCVQASLLIDTYEKRGIQLFSPAGVDMGNGNSSIVTPPVIEDSGRQRVVITGCARLFTCFQKRRDWTVKCLIVRGVKEQLPGRPVKIQNVEVVRRKTPPEERIQDFDYTHFRDIEGAVHPV